MVRTAWNCALAIGALSLVLFGTSQATAQAPCYAPPVVSYYSPPPAVLAPAPVVSYYYAPAVAYAPATVSYYTPSVSYYAAPAVPFVSYYAAPGAPVVSAPAAVTTTRYGLFGRPRVTTTYYIAR